MPVMDGYEATKILRTGKEYAGLASEAELSPHSHPHHSQGSNNDHSTNGHKSQVSRTSENGVSRAGDRDTASSIRNGAGRLRDIPVIAMAASAIQGDREKCYKAGMDDYLAKPVEKEKLEDTLVKWAGSRRHPT